MCEDTRAGSPASLGKGTVNWERVNPIAEITVGFGTRIIRVKTGWGYVDCCFLDSQLVRTKEVKVDEKI